MQIRIKKDFSFSKIISTPVNDQFKLIQRTRFDLIKTEQISVSEKFHELGWTIKNKQLRILKSIENYKESTLKMKNFGKIEIFHFFNFNEEF